MLDKFRKLNTQAFVVVCIIAFVILLIVGALFLLYILMNLKDIGVGCLTLTIPLVLLVIVAIFAKKYLFGGGKK
jgi:membrane protease YdiL (CAAX protease family)